MKLRVPNILSHLMVVRFILTDIEMGDVCNRIHSISKINHDSTHSKPTKIHILPLQITSRRLSPKRSPRIGKIVPFKHSRLVNPTPQQSIGTKQFYSKRSTLLDPWKAEKLNKILTKPAVPLPISKNKKHGAL